MPEQTSHQEQPDTPEPGGQPAEDEELEGMMSSIRKAERRQRVRAALYAVSTIVLIAVAVYGFFAYRDELMPAVDLDEAGQMAWEKTNDPQCRQLIDQVTVIGEDFNAYESVVEENLLGDDPDKIREIKRRMDSFEARLNKAEELSKKAQLRYEDSARQLDEWFDYVDMEIGFVRRLADERLAELEREAAEKGEGDASAEKKGASQEDAGILVHSPDADEASEGDQPKKSPEQRRDGALIALHDAFQNFRVWHSANAHPCGAAAEDEEPWRPSKGPGSDEKTDPDAPAE